MCARSTFGNFLQKWAQNHQASLPDDEKAPVIFSLIISWRWMLGLLLMVVVPLPFDSAAFALAPQSLITPFGGLTLVLTLMLGPRLLGETIERQVRPLPGARGGSQPQTSHVHKSWRAPSVLRSRKIL